MKSFHSDHISLEASSVLLEGRMVSVRNLKQSDLVKLVQWKNDPEIAYLVRGYPILTTLSQESKRFQQSKSLKDGARFAITTKEGLFIGMIALGDIDKINKKASLGMLIGEKEFWNKGYGTDALTALLDYMFNKLYFNRVTLEVFDYNLRAKKAYQKIGFRIEGIQREGLVQEDGYHDIYIMGITKKDFNSLRNIQIT